MTGYLQYLHYPGPTWGIWSDKRILSSERVGGWDGGHQLKALWQKQARPVGLLLWLTRKRKTYDKRRPEIANNKTTQNKYDERDEWGEGVTGGIVCEGFDGSMTLFKIVDVIGDGAHWDSWDDYLHPLVRWGGHFTLYLRLALHKVLVRPIKSVRPQPDLTPDRHSFNWGHVIIRPGELTTCRECRYRAGEIDVLRLISKHCNIVN